MVNITKLPAISCPKCKGTRVSKTPRTFTCDDCRITTDLKTGKVHHHVKNWHERKAYIPKEKDDYEPLN